MGALLSLHEVSLAFARGRRHMVRALDGVCLDLGAGELLAVLAQRAQGKSTLLRVAAGTERPDEGRVCFDGKDLWLLSDKHRSKLLAQEICLLEHGQPELDLTARELVALPLLRVYGRRQALVGAGQVLRRVGLVGCDDQRWASLADSERALLTIARGIVRKPRLLVADDLMIQLGLVAAEEIGRLLRSLAKEDGFAVLMSVADAQSTVYCDRVGSLAGGKLVLASDGTSNSDGNVVAFPAAPWRRALP